MQLKKNIDVLNNLMEHVKVTGKQKQAKRNRRFKFRAEIDEIKTKLIQRPV